MRIARITNHNAEHDRHHDFGNFDQNLTQALETDAAIVRYFHDIKVHFWSPI